MVILEAVRDLSAPVMVTLSDEVIPSAERVPVDVKLRPWISPVTVADDPVNDPPTESVPVMSTGPPTTRLAVASKLETEMVPGSLALLRVPEVTLEAFRSSIPSPEPMKSEALKVPVMSAGPPTTRLAVASMLETEIVPPDNLLLTVKFEVSTLDADRVPVML